MCKDLDKFAISHHLQSLICFSGQSIVFEEGEKLFEQMLGLSVSSKQIQRVSEYYGKKIEELETSENITAVPVLGRPDKPVYCLFDGSMLFTREEKWKEIKLGRIFSHDDIVAIQPKRKELIKSNYISHFGGHKEFFKKLERYLEPYKKIIFIGDGAKWIWNWVEDFYPNAIQILDFFHAIEKISQFAVLQFEEESHRKKWIETQQDLLMNDKVAEVISILENVEARDSKAEKSRIDTLRYYQNNKNRMLYKTYKDKGYLIGSGAIEAAHRNVIQQRLKLSGQRWSIKGAQQIVNLRAYEKSGRWMEVQNLIRNAA